MILRLSSVKIEMARCAQEAGRIGGVGPCMRVVLQQLDVEFRLRIHIGSQIPGYLVNPQKLAGQCGKLKCCMNYEVDAYVEASRKLPSREIVLQTRDCDYYHFKTDILSGQITYSTDKNNPVNLETISKERAFQIIEWNKKGKKPPRLAPETETSDVKEGDIHNDLLGDQSITRFDKKKAGGATKRRKSRKGRRPDNRNKKGRPPKQMRIKRLIGSFVVFLFLLHAARGGLPTVFIRSGTTVGQKR